MKTVERLASVRRLELPPNLPRVRRTAIDPNAGAGDERCGRRQQEYDGRSRLRLGSESLQRNLAGDLILDMGSVFRLVGIQPAGRNRARRDSVDAHVGG